MEAILPDLNTGYIKYRNKILESVDSGKFLNAIGSLYAENGMLPKDYQVKINDDIFNDLIKHNTIVKCNNCTSEYPTVKDATKSEERQTEHNFEDIRVYTSVLDSDLSFILGKDLDKLWLCPKCNKTNRLTASKFIKTALEKPFFLGVVPNPPQRKDGIDDKQTYYKKIRKWVWNFLDELEYKMGEYRRNYVPKNGVLQEGTENSSLENSEESWI